MDFNDKQVKILEVSEKMFAEKGYDGTSIRAISKEADINIAMISYYFGSKEKLLEALLSYKTASFSIELESVLSKDIDYLEKLDEIITLIIRRVHKNRRIYKIIHFEYSNETRQIDFDSYIKSKTENFRIIQNFVNEGQEAGVFSKNINVPLVVPTVLGSYFNFYYNKRFFVEIHQLNTNDSLDDYVHIILTNHIKQTIKALFTHEN